MNDFAHRFRDARARRGQSQREAAGEMPVPK